MRVSTMDDSHHWPNNTSYLWQDNGEIIRKVDLTFKQSLTAIKYCNIQCGFPLGGLSESNLSPKQSTPERH